MQDVLMNLENTAVFRTRVFSTHMKVRVAGAGGGGPKGKKCACFEKLLGVTRLTQEIPGQAQHYSTGQEHLPKVF